MDVPPNYHVEYYKIPLTKMFRKDTFTEKNKLNQWWPQAAEIVSKWIGGTFWMMGSALRVEDADGYTIL